MKSIQLRALDLDGIDRLAQSMLARIPTGTSIGLVGTLGAGKTTLVQCLARAAGIDTADVTSPTFTLLQTHTGSIVIHHLDAYRVADDDEFLELGVEELWEDSTAWTLVEWADRVADCMPATTLWIQIDIDPGGATRSITIKTGAPDLQTALDQIAGDTTGD